MSRQETSNAQLIHHYTHVACALNETCKGSVSDGDATTALNKSIVGVCGLIDQLVAAEHRECVTANQRASS